MKPENYLRERGKEIFEAIVAHCKKTGKYNEAFARDASVLANSYDMYHRAASNILKKGYRTTTKSGYEQRSVDYLVMQDQLQNILKLSTKFGLNPKDMLVKMQKKEDAQTRIDKLRKVN